MGKDQVTAASTSLRVSQGFNSVALYQTWSNLILAIYPKQILISKVKILVAKYMQADARIR